MSQRSVVSGEQMCSKSRQKYVPSYQQQHNDTNETNRRSTMCYGSRPGLSHFWRVGSVISSWSPIQTSCKISMRAFSSKLAACMAAYGLESIFFC